MKILNYLSLAIVAICIVSCGNKKSDSVTLQVESDLGALASYVSINEPEVTLKVVDDEINGSIGVSVKKAFKGEYSWDLEFDIEILDESHICIAKLNEVELDATLDHNINVGNKRVTIKESKGDSWADISSKGKYIYIKWTHKIDEIMEYEGQEAEDDSTLAGNYDSDNNDGSDLFSTSGSDNWDALLDSYEEYVDQYISYVEDAANGNMTALAEYPSLLKKAQEFSSKMSNAEGDMSPSQWSRYIEITSKMSQAVSDMQ